MGKQTIEELEAQVKQLAIDAGCYKRGMEASNERLDKLAAENAIKHEFIATCFRAAADGASIDGDDIQELGERLGLFERQTYQPALHGYICGHEAGEDSVYVMKKSPATDEYAASLRAEGVDMAIQHLHSKFEGTGNIGVPVMALEWLATQLRSQSEQVKGVQS